MKQVRPGVWVHDDFHFTPSEEDMKWVDEKNRETREILEKFLTELKKSGRMVPIIGDVSN